LNKLKMKFYLSLLICMILLLELINPFSPVKSNKAYANNTKENQSYKCDFNNGNSKGWSVISGKWEVKNNVYNVNAGPGFKSIEKENTFQNFVYEADISASSNGYAGLLFKVSKTSDVNGYDVSINPSKDEVILNKFNRIQTQMGVASFKLDKKVMYHLKVAVKGRFIDVYINDTHVISAADIQDSFPDAGYVGLESSFNSSSFDNVSVRETEAFTNPTYDFSWVKGAVFVPTNVVNEVQQWDQYDPQINDRELYYASIYGINCVRVYLHYLVWNKDKTRFLKNIEDFLTRADKYGIKTEFVFFDDCWDPSPSISKTYPKPLEGVHNSRWVQCPGDSVKADYEKYKASLKAYVQDVVNAHKEDKRIAFWEPYNEPGNGKSGIYYDVTNQILTDSRIWIKDTGSEIPMTSTDFANTEAIFMSDFYSWHPYDSSYTYPVFDYKSGKLVTEGMRRREKDAQTIPGMVDAYYKKGKGFIVWEFGIGRDNCRFSWSENRETPANNEPTIPFHGIVYPDGHPWSIDDVKAIMGDSYNKLSIFNVEYYAGDFKILKKKSITPLIDFDLGDEKGTGSPDASAGIDKDNFSIRWSYKINPKATGKYTFYIDSDNIARLWIDSKLVINKTSGKREEKSGEISLDAETSYNIKIEYVHKNGAASMHVKWSGQNLTKQLLK
jgi:hypothetical protein